MTTPPRFEKVEEALNALVEKIPACFGHDDRGRRANHNKPEFGAPLCPACAVLAAVAEEVERAGDIKDAQALLEAFHKGRAGGVAQGQRQAFEAMMKMNQATIDGTVVEVPEIRESLTAMLADERAQGRREMAREALTEYERFGRGEGPTESFVAWLAAQAGEGKP